MVECANSPIVAIVGGGFSGAVVAARLAAQLGEGRVKIIVFEPRAHLGRGLAYDTDNPSHRINVPADRMTLDPDDDQHLIDWLGRHDDVSRDPAQRTGEGKLYPRRGAFGRYVSDFVAPHLESGVVRHVRSRVSHVGRSAAAWTVLTEEGAEFRADLLVIATSHPAPSTPAEFRNALENHPRFIADTTVPHALDLIRRDDSVLVVGTGLTAADVIATLDAAGHRGPTTFFSRRGLRSRGHPRRTQTAYGDFATDPARSALALLRRVRATIRAAMSEDVGWHAVFDAVRRDAGTVWRNLPLAEKRKLIRHLRPFWDAHRFRIAPQVEDVIDAKLAAGSLRLLAARAIRVERHGAQIRVTLHRRGSPDVDVANYDAVVVTTGPAHGGILANQPWLDGMARDGLVALDGTGLGLSCDEESRALGPDGRVTPGLFVSGPLARGTFGELMGLPQVSDHATLVAEKLADVVGHFSGVTAPAARDPALSSN